jgi:G6PDH family F420-dependent oxidoreductase
VSPSFGYTMMCEQSGAAQLVADVQSAEAAGFDFSVISDHYQPWLTAQGHSPYAWSVLGAAAQATERIPLMTYVTCPLIRYHPVVVAQKAATVQNLSKGRFRLGLGAGERLNEHVVGVPWPSVGTRHRMLVEALEIIGALLAGDGAVNYRGSHFGADQARLWDPPERPVPIGVAASGRESCRLAASADLLIAVQPEAKIVEAYQQAGGGGARVGQVGVSYDADRDVAIRRAREQFRWFGLGWKVMAELPNPDGFEAASAAVTPEDVAESIPCGPDVELHVQAVKRFLDAGFDEVALVQIGGEHQGEFIAWAERELLPALRSL